MTERSSEAKSFARIHGELKPNYFNFVRGIEEYRDYWQTVANGIYELGLELQDPLVWHHYEQFYLNVHQHTPNFTLRQAIERFRSRNIADKFQTSFLDKMDKVHSQWLQLHGKSPDYWVPSILDSNTEFLKNLFRIIFNP